jgi:hypothetical protein
LHFALVVRAKSIGELSDGALTVGAVTPGAKHRLPDNRLGEN